MTMNGDSPFPINPLAMHEVYTKGNMESIVSTIIINISKAPGIMENVFVRVDFSPKEIQIYIELSKEFHDIFSWYYKDMPGIDPC
jgi:hypothetical protein